MTYLLMIWMTIGGVQSFATHQFTKKETCESFARWLVKDQRAHDAHAMCVINEGWEI